MKCTVWTSIFALSALVSLTDGFGCQHERDLDAGTTETQFTIRPQMSRDKKFLWITNMNIFLFGSIDRPHNTKFEAGFYNDDTDEPVYKVIIDCQNSAWKTMYQPKKGNPKKWREGIIDGGCPKGEFDLIATIGCLDYQHDLHDPTYPLPCARMAYFVFNGQVLEHDLQQVVLGWGDNEVLGPMYPEELPVYIRTAKRFKARVIREGATFNQEAYGKCVEFPTSLHDNCDAAREYVLSRSNYINSGVSVPSMAPMSMLYQPRCNRDNPAMFQTEQLSVVPDGKSFLNGQGFNTCCCSYTDGFLADCRTDIDAINCAYRGAAYEDFKGRCEKYNLPMRVFDETTGRYEMRPIEA